jgi:mannose-1-phosphate guanylyltransferase
MGGDRTLLQETVARLDGEVPFERLWVITQADQHKQTALQLESLSSERLLVEPCGRDTAACIGLAAAILHRADPEAVMAVMPADHWIRPAPRFRDYLRAALAEAERGGLVTLGVPPSRPATGYGYIEAGDPAVEQPGIVFRPVRSFREKPERSEAEGYLRSGGFYWNSGIFFWRASEILQALASFLPGHAERIGRIARAWGTERRREVLSQEYPLIEKVSIDFGVLEPAGRKGLVRMAEVDFEWDDLGSWPAWARHIPGDGCGNQSDAPFMGVDARRCIVSAEEGHLVAAVGVEDLVIIQSADATLVCRRDRVQQVKEVVRRLEEEGKSFYV